jgi:hypothetical protein
MTNSAVVESGRTITNSSSAIGGILESLGSAIENFSYKISFSPSIFEPGQFDIEKLIESGGRQGFALPKLGWKISGKLDGKSSDLVDTIKNAANYFTAAGNASRSGYHRYGTSPTVGTNNTLLDPDEYELEGGKRKKGKGSGGGKASTEKLKEIKERYHEITEEIEYHEELLDKIDK